LPARGGREGIDHFGFQVEDMEGTLKTAAAAGAQGDAAKKPRDGRFAEMGGYDPAGQLIDCSVEGWKEETALFTLASLLCQYNGEEANPGIGDKARESLDNPNGADRPTISFDVRNACRRSNEALDRPRRHQQQRRAAVDRQRAGDFSEIWH